MVAQAGLGQERGRPAVSGWGRPAGAAADNRAPHAGPRSASSPVGRPSDKETEHRGLLPVGRLGGGDTLTCPASYPHAGAPMSRSRPRGRLGAGPGRAIGGAWPSRPDLACGGDPGGRCRPGCWRWPRARPVAARMVRRHRPRCSGLPRWVDEAPPPCASAPTPPQVSTPRGAPSGAPVGGGRLVGPATRVQAHHVPTPAWPGAVAGEARRRAMAGSSGPGRPADRLWVPRHHPPASAGDDARRPTERGGSRR